MSSPPNDPLSRVLADWRVTPRRNPEFRRRVRARLAGARGGPSNSWASYARSHAAAVSGLLALAIALGALGGRERARARLENESGELARAYVQSLDARAMRMP
ncbi:MAG TPA: hypothetical protein VHD62_04670 [Opitutaceae bacterium]|nr:hypothetical protein [Opitutaceae bacterium]